MILRIKDLSKRYQDREIFDHAELTVRAGDKLAVLGQNGSGKSTLLRIIMGLEEAAGSEPAYAWAPNVLVEYLPQEVIQHDSRENIIDSTPVRQAEARLKSLSQELGKAPSEDLLRQYNLALAEFESLGAYGAIDEIKVHAQALSLPLEKLYAPISSLSGGEMMRASLAKILSSRADCLVLDEPSNHLDADGLEFLENFLKESNKTLIFVSHDRNLIDAVANRTVAIEAGKLLSYSGNYSQRLRWDAAREHERLVELKKTESAFQKEKEIAQTLLSHRNISAYHSRLRKAEKLKSKLNSLRSREPEKERQLEFKLLQAADSRRSERVLIHAQNISVDYGSGPLFKNFNLSLRSGQKLAFVGPNGCGKSSLLKALTGKLEAAASGDLRYAYDLSMASLEQRVSFPNEEQDLLSELRSRFPKIPESAARALLARFAFYDLEVFKKLQQLSGGERSRLNLLLILLEQPDVLILDEPTNHLDLKSKEVLEDALLDYQGAILAVSHDRHFLKKLNLGIQGFIGEEIKPFEDYPSYRRAYKEAKITAELKAEAEAEHRRHAELEARKHDDESRETVEFNWSKAELELWPELKSLPQSLKKPQEQRQFKAKARLFSQEILSEVEKLNSQAAEVEKEFTEAKSNNIYAKYAEILEREKSLTELYFKLCESLEKLER